MSNNEEYYLYSEFNDKLEEIINKTVSEYLKDKLFQPSDNEFFIEQLNSQLLKKLERISANFKYIIKTIFFKDDSSGLSLGSVGYYDTNSDGIFQNKYVFPGIGCLLTIFIVAL